VARERLTVRKTYKLYVGGGFPRSESGRSYPVRDRDGEIAARAARASRKDLRDAVKAARGAFPGWSSATSYKRGQILYRVAELMEGRRAQFVDEVGRGGSDQPDREVDAAIDRWVWYAGWSDKIHHILGSVNPTPWWCWPRSRGRSRP
jgi:acyl-CoA reductase-like NAD-dependent aldehyde dehydrogenase